MPVATWKIVTLLGKRKEAPIQAQLGTRMQPNIYTHCPNDKDFVFISDGEIRTKSLHHLPCSDTLLKEEKKKDSLRFSRLQSSQSGEGSLVLRKQRVFVEELHINVVVSQGDRIGLTSQPSVKV